MQGALGMQGRCKALAVPLFPRNLRSSKEVYSLSISEQVWAGTVQILVYCHVLFKLPANRLWAEAFLCHLSSLLVSIRLSPWFHNEERGKEQKEQIVKVLKILHL